ncbi:hypothetical protein QQS21_002497 [Conoideocrella luteorostrata]|uniref:Uncharacterized protein n=1 Tax=Conoideocrella luteorostrata TaxID=1105319 RepID=A0AAJ0CUZ2_9HYPO|nr:hypothetical protein QQS21_002497 [Conoideocrella luteorostrata]
MIVSRSGIYSGHYWENIGFNIDADIHGDLYKDQDDAFQKSIVDALHKGAKGHPSLTGAAQVIGNDDSIKAFLIAPDEGPAKEGEVAKKDPYTDAWGKMQDEIGKIIPKLQDKNNKNRWEIVKYHLRKIRREKSK